MEGFPRPHVRRRGVPVGVQVMNDSGSVSPLVPVVRTPLLPTGGTPSPLFTIDYNRVHGATVHLCPWSQSSVLRSVTAQALGTCASFIRVLSRVLPLRTTTTTGVTRTPGPGSPAPYGRLATSLSVPADFGDDRVTEHVGSVPPPCSARVWDGNLGPVHLSSRPREAVSDRGGSCIRKQTFCSVVDVPRTRGVDRPGRIVYPRPG